MSNFTELLKGIPLKIRVFVFLQMEDIENWKDGMYLGDNEKLRAKVNSLIQIFEEFYNDGMPDGFQPIDKNDHLSRTTGLVTTD